VQQGRVKSKRICKNVVCVHDNVYRLYFILAKQTNIVCKIAHFFVGYALELFNKREYT